MLSQRPIRWTVGPLARGLQGRCCPETADVEELAVSSVHDVDSLGQMLTCEMEDTVNKDGE